MGLGLEESWLGALLPSLQLEYGTGWKPRLGSLKGLVLEPAAESPIAYLRNLNAEDPSTAYAVILTSYATRATRTLYCEGVHDDTKIHGKGKRKATKVVELDPEDDLEEEQRELTEEEARNWNIWLTI